MSYEGFDQHICKQGHLYVTDCMDENLVCPLCSSPAAFTNSVDDTNCDRFGFIPKFKILTEAKWQECACCHHRTKVQETTYQIPSEEEAKKMQTFIDSEDGVVRFIETREKWQG